MSLVPQIIYDVVFSFTSPVPSKQFSQRQQQQIAFCVIQSVLKSLFSRQNCYTVHNLISSNIPVIMKFKLITVRHGQTLGNAASMLQGHDDSPLTPLGIASSAKTGNALREIQFNQVEIQQRAMIILINTFL